MSVIFIHFHFPGFQTFIRASNIQFRSLVQGPFGYISKKKSRYCRGFYREASSTCHTLAIYSSDRYLRIAGSKLMMSGFIIITSLRDNYWTIICWWCTVYSGWNMTALTYWFLKAFFITPIIIIKVTHLCNCICIRCRIDIGSGPCIW